MLKGREEEKEMKIRREGRGREWKIRRRKGRRRGRRRGRRGRGRGWKREGGVRE